MTSSAILARPQRTNGVMCARAYGISGEMTYEGITSCTNEYGLGLGLGWVGLLWQREFQCYGEKRSGVERKYLCSKTCSFLFSSFLVPTCRINITQSTVTIRSVLILASVTIPSRPRNRITIIEAT